MIGSLTKFYSFASKLSIIKHRSEKKTPTFNDVRGHFLSDSFKRELQRIKQFLSYNTLWLDKNPFRNNMYLIQYI